ncbi:MAG: DUF1194 domain-containing protein [Alphaproteobacteria bacterium]|nr:DUF1194 domain-containing protein [Alphaproteobacteria bacterium]
MHRLTASTAIIALTLTAGLFSPAIAAEEVDLELVLAADGSGSIDDEELRLQREGYARALAHPKVLSAIGSGFLGKIAIAYVEWGGPDSQHTIVDWTVVDGLESAAAFGAKLVAAPRAAVSYNSISNAIVYSQNLIESNDYAGLRRIIDVSADAGNLGGVPLAFAREQALAAGITINGLAISRPGSTRPFRGITLEAHFAQDVVGGPGAFVVTVDETLSFADAVIKKLVLEIASKPHTPPQLGELPVVPLDQPPAR